MGKPISYRDLVVWQKAMQLIDEIDEIVKFFDSYQRWWLGIQMHRAALSTASNIAEGHDADYRQVYLRHLSVAKGSNSEIETQLLVVQRRAYAPNECTQSALKLNAEIGRMLRKLSARLRGDP